MTDRDRLLGDLKAADEVRRRHGRAVSKAQADAQAAKAKIRITAQYKAWQLAEANLQRELKQYREACNSHDQVEAELLTGKTGLELFDGAKQSAEAEAVAS
jgi:hypothetical protein